MITKLRSWLHKLTEPPKPKVSQEEIARENKKKELDQSIEKLQELQELFKHIFKSYNRRTRRLLLRQLYEDKNFGEELISKTKEFLKQQSAIIDPKNMAKYQKNNKSNEDGKEIKNEKKEEVVNKK